MLVCGEPAAAESLVQLDIRRRGETESYRQEGALGVELTHDHAKAQMRLLQLCVSVCVEVCEVPDGR